MNQTDSATPDNKDVIMRPTAAPNAANTSSQTAQDGISPSPADSITLVNYGHEIEVEISKLQQMIDAHETLRTTYNSRWLAINLLEGDTDLEAKIKEIPEGAPLLVQADQMAKQVTEAVGEDIDTLIADYRYRFIADLVDEAVTRSASAAYTRSDQIDHIVTHSWVGIPLFLALMWFVFQMTANLSGIYRDWVDGVIAGPFARWVVAMLGWIGLGGSWFESLIVDGVITGAGSVLVFVPVLMFLYFFIALLEDTGYMARVAFVMDRFMGILGLHGKSFIPLLVAFGCSVPGIYATRTLHNRRDRILTGLLVPFMSCAARLPVYVLIGTAFFGANSGNLVFAMYLLGVLVAVLSGLLFRRALLRRYDQSPFVMELPPFRRPSFKTIGRQVWDRTMGFVTGVGTMIVGTSIIVWVLLNIPYQSGDPPELGESLFGDLSRTVAPVFKPAGFGNWQAAGSLATGMIAKEIVISTMGQVYDVADVESERETQTPSFIEDLGDIVLGFGQATIDTVKATISLIPGIDLFGEEVDGGNTELQAVLRKRFSPLEAVAFSVFVLLYTPCVATVGAIRQEFGTRWMWFNIVYMLGVAWLAAVLTYQVGGLLGLG